MLERFTKLGYRNADPEFSPHDTGRYGFYKLEKNGNFYFAKFSREHAKNIATELWWYDAVQRLHREGKLAIRTPHVVEHGDDWYIVEWIDAHPSVEPTGSSEELSKYLRSYALCLAELDALELSDDVMDAEPSQGSPKPYDQPEKSWQEWAKRPLEEGILTPEQLHQAYQLVDTYRPHIEVSRPRLQHGDFVPWHLLIDANNDWWLIDGEHASTQKPRYYDLAYMYSRIFTLLHSPDHAAQLLREFIQNSKEPSDKIYRALLPIMTSRAIGMHFDAINDLRDGKDYRHAAQDLLARCLSEDPSQLF